MRVVKRDGSRGLEVHGHSPGEPPRRGGEAGAPAGGLTGFQSVFILAGFAVGDPGLKAFWATGRASMRERVCCPRTSSYSSRLANGSPQMCFSTGSRRGHAPHLTAGRAGAVQLQRRAACHPAAQSPFRSGWEANRVGG